MNRPLAVGVAAAAVVVAAIALTFFIDREPDSPIPPPAAEPPAPLGLGGPPSGVPG